jgi:TolB protein
MRRLKQVLVLFSCLALSFTSSAATIELKVTQGFAGAIPITIIPMDGQESLPSEAQPGAIVSGDLGNSGLFRVSDASGERTPASPQQVDIDYWRGKLVDNLVFGRVSQVGGGRVRVDVALVSTVGKQKILLSQNFTVPQGQLRGLSHHISDLIYEQLTGDKGVFSTRIAYVVALGGQRPHTYKLEVADADGYNPKAVLVSPQPIMSPSWSPDGRRLAYVSFENKVAQIYVVTVATGQRELITSYPGINGAPSWSPDGRKLAVVLSKYQSPNIYIVDVASKALQQVTNNDSINTEPNWAPNGKNIIFTSDRGGSPQVYRQNLPNGSTERVSYTGEYNARPLYTADGKYIVMLHRSEGRFNIARQDVHTGSVTVLTRSDRNESPAVAPNGKMVMYATQYGGRKVLSIVSTDGRVQMRLPAREGDVQEPAWGPSV